MKAFVNLPVPTQSARISIKPAIVEHAAPKQATPLTLIGTCVVKQNTAVQTTRRIAFNPAETGYARLNAAQHERSGRTVDICV